MLRTTWMRILHSKGRLVLTALAVAIGVAFLTGALVLADSTSAALHDSYAQVYAGADVIVRGPDTFNDGPFTGALPLDRDVVEGIDRTAGVAQAEGRVRSVAQLLSDDAGEGEGALAMAVPADPAGASIELRAGRLPQRQGEVAVDAAVAAGQDLSVGDRVGVLLPDGTADGEIVGIVGFGRLDGLAGGARVLFDADTATERFGGDGYAQIAVRARSDTAPSTLAERLARTLGDDAMVLTGEEAARRDAAAVARQTAVLSYIVMAVAAIALTVGAFLVANTFRMLVGQRSRELALLRAIGASRRQVARSVRLEAAITGGIGAAFGVVLGVGAGALLVETSAGLLPGIPPASPTVTPKAVFAGPVVGIVMALLAAHGSARRALAVPPVAAMRAITAPTRRSSPVRTLAGPLLLAAGGGAAAIGVQADSSALLAVGAVGLIVGFGAVFPLATGPVLSVLSRPLDHAGVAGALARQQALAAPRRTAATAATLAVALALVSFLMVLSATLGAASADLVTARQDAEFLIRPTARQGLHDFLFAAADRVERLPQVAVARVVTYGEVRVVDPGSGESRPRTVTAFVSDPVATPELFDVTTSAGDLAEMTDGVAVRDTVAAAHDWQVGDRLPLEFPDGSAIDVRVAALFDGAVTTDWILAPQTAQDHLPAAYREAFVKLADDADPDAVRPLLATALDEHPAVSLLSREQLAAETAEANDSTLGIITALFSLSLVVGVLGVVNTLTLAIVERIRELGLLRAVGATRRQVRAMIRWEAVLTSALGAVMGATLGLALAWIAAQALPSGTGAFTVPSWHIAAAVLVTAVLGVVASAVPSVRAARIDVLAAIQQE